MSTKLESGEHSSSSSNNFGSIDTIDPSLEEWRKGIRARVTALKCHIMATHGLSPEGQAVEPYSPQILMEAEHNAQYLQFSDKDELHKFVDQAIEKLPHFCQNKDRNTKGDMILEDIQLSLSSDISTTPLASPLTAPASLPFMTNPSGPPSIGCCSFPKETLKESEKIDLELAETRAIVPESAKIGKMGDRPGDEVDAIKQELKVKVNEVEKLSKIRDEVENELQELTANLFQEAHNMVQEANQKAACAEKSLKEATMQVEVLQAEVVALKALVITSTPSAPNPHLHPQLISRGAQAIVTEAGKIFQRGHKKSPSDFDLKYGRDTTPPSSPLKDCRISDSQGLSNSFPLDPECWEVDPVVHKEFVTWRQDPVLTRDDPFMSRVYMEDIDLCLSFPNSTLAFKVQKAIDDNALYIEEVNPRQKNACPKKCVLLDVPRYCKYRFRLGEKDETWYYISQLARNRIIAVCDFLNYLRYIQLGLVKSSIHDVYWEIVKRRREMAMARLGF